MKIDKKFTPEFPKNNLLFRLKIKIINKAQIIRKINNLFSVLIKNK